MTYNHPIKQFFTSTVKQIIRRSAIAEKLHIMDNVNIQYMTYYLLFYNNCLCLYHLLPL